MKALVIDDNIELRDLLAETLEGNGFLVYKASNGHEGLKFLECMNIDVVISDIQMPVMNGFEFLLRARNQFGRKLQIYLITGYSQYTPEQIYNAGADGYFEKPFEVDQLLSRLPRAS